MIKYSPMKNIIFCGFLACACAFAARADVVEFKSGSRLTGKVTNVTGGVVEFTADDVGPVKIPEGKISKLTTDEPNTLQYTDLSEEKVVLAYAEGAWKAADGRVIDMASVKAVNPVAEKWHGSVNISASSAHGNTVSEKVAVLAAVSRRWESDRFTANGGYYFAQSGDSKDTKRKSEDRFVLTAQEDHFWANKIYSYLNGKYETDRILDLDRRYRLGAGLGYQWLENRAFDLTGTWSFNQEAGLEYVAESWRHSDPDADESYASFRYAHHLKYTPRWVSSLAWFHNLEYHPQVDEWQDVYVINADLGFTTVVWAGWDLLAKIEWDYNSLPAAHAKNSDVRYLVGLGYKW